MPTTIDPVPPLQTALPACRGTVLIVDDDQGPRESMKAVLETTYHIHTADSVDAALALLDSVGPDCVILDIRMPGRDGIEGLREIRARNPVTSIVMCTAHASLETAQQAIRLQANDYIRKPFSARDLLKTVAEQVARSRLQQARQEAGSAMEAIENKLAGELSKAQDMAQVGMAASALVHDLRNPLTSLIAYVEVLDHELHTLETGLAPGLANASHALIDKINSNLRRCRELTSTWRSITDAKAMNPDAFDLNLLMVELAADPPTDHEQRNRRLLLHGPDGPLRVVADRSQIRRVMLNLLLNAIQATDPEKGEILLQWEPAGGTVRISVRDNGVGIPPTVRDHVWEPYFTHHTPGGTGLGLFIVKRIVDLHHGTVELDSTPGVGTTFTVSLPLVDQASWSRLYP